jgi:acetyl esterase/lipase
MSYVTTVRFLLATLKNKGADLPVISKELKAKSGAVYPLDIYEPADAAKYKGTILFLHGMNKHGNKDERMVALCRAAAFCNYRAISPTYQTIAEHNVTLKSIDEFDETISEFIKDESLCPDGKLAVFTASLSGSFSLRAIARPHLADKVTSLCTVGICYNPKTTFGNILKGKSNDAYAKYIAIKGLLAAANDLSNELRQGLDFAIDDAFEEDGKNRAGQFAETIADLHKKRLLEIIARVESNQDLSGLYEKEILILHEALKDISDLSGVHSRVTLIHSEGDNVLPSIESELLFEHLIKAGKQAKLLVTPVLDHADFQFKLKHLRDLKRLVSAFDYFFAGVC